MPLARLLTDSDNRHFACLRLAFAIVITVFLSFNGSDYHKEEERKENVDFFFFFFFSSSFSLLEAGILGKNRHHRTYDNNVKRDCTSVVVSHSLEQLKPREPSLSLFSFLFLPIQFLV